MKILITGALGYIGNQILKKVANKHEIYACDNSSEAIETYYPIWKDKVHLVPEDVCVVDSCGVDLVIHLAAEVGYVSCDKKPELAQKTNIEGTKRIASFELPTLFFSTSSVYGLVPNSSYVCDENFPCNPQTIYSKTKFAGEEIISKLKSKCIFRPATIYGVGHKTRDDLLIHNFVDLAIKSKSFEVYQPNSIRIFYHLDKIADLVLHCINNWSLFENKIINVGSKSSTITKKEILDKISNYLDFKVKLVDGKDADCRDYAVDFSLLESLWDNSFDNIDYNLPEIIDYYKNDRV